MFALYTTYGAERTDGDDDDHDDDDDDDCDNDDDNGNDEGSARVNFIICSLGNAAMHCLQEGGTSLWTKVSSLWAYFRPL